MDYVKLARATLDEFLDKLEDEAKKLLEQDKEPSKKSEQHYGWHDVKIKVFEVKDTYGQRYELVTDRNKVVDRSFSKAQLLERWGLEED